MLVGLPYLRDVCRKARSGCFGPFVRYEYFPAIIARKKEEKEENSKKKEEEEIKNYNFKKREEKTQHNPSRNITTEYTNLEVNQVLASGIFLDLFKCCQA